MIMFVQISLPRHYPNTVFVYVIQTLIEDGKYCQYHNIDGLNILYNEIKPSNCL